jgi:hypothetical protein
VVDEYASKPVIKTRIVVEGENLKIPGIID